ncbi:hypothetical protein PV383_44110 [Streptomyces caniscabiei]|uniref:Scaffolding protein n=1 Tax=Streptomyces caniscabiei TaxID=2746961 RepID=A0ABU4N3H0_9ACTN|nr:hypothetical protein [Streptomyces caniscabiei]MDX3044100.1 hypothetical protein [Streptomyces caniscabiei]
MPQNTRRRFLRANPMVLFLEGGDGGDGGGSGGGAPGGGNPNPGPGPDDPKGKDGGNPQGDPGGEPKPDDDPLGEAGKKALETERTARKEAERKLGELETEVSRLRRANAANKGTDVEAIKAEIRSEFAEGLVEAQLEAAATGRLAKPEDAVLFVGRDTIAELAKGGRPDKAAISKAIDDVLAERPYLAGKAEPQWGDVGGGHRPGPSADVEPGLGRLRHAYATETKTK